ncbi:MAG: geranylgeranylglycerol-phosphate geranylgeranyltransferase [Flavobacteriales bacterium]|nr:geranylgeranylglycerol-phosphate geranylgeranyltransferase [Flavobacteriales bacterium]
MKVIIDFIRLVRFPNLIIIFLTQYAIRFGIIQPFLKQVDLDLFMSEKLFFLLAVATILIAAAGYIINDYFDIKLDLINKPKKLIIGNSISRRYAMLWHTLLNIAGIALAAYVAIAIKHPLLVFIQIICSALLWYYSVKFKKQVLVGNVLIAVLTALVPFTAGYYELAVMYDTIGESVYDTNLKYMLFDMKYLLYWIIGYSAFAFLLTMIREIAKDMEDIEGDKAFNCKTLPIVHGIDFSKRIAIGISVFTFLWILSLEFMQVLSGDFISFAYFTFFISFPLIFVIYRTAKAQTKKDFFIVSQSIKVIMLLGILYTLVIYFFQT